MNDLMESQTTEFKQIWKDNYLKTICAFANSDGGEETPIEKKYNVLLFMLYR